MVLADKTVVKVTYISWSGDFVSYFLCYYMDLHYTWINVCFFPDTVREHILVVGQCDLYWAMI